LKASSVKADLASAKFGLGSVFLVLSLIEAINWDHFFALPLRGLVLHSPVHDVVIVDPKIIPHPENNPVVFFVSRFLRIKHS
jgi:hypothetical protein